MTVLLKSGIENLKQKENLSKAKAKLKLEELELQKDGSVRSIADYIGKIIGHFIFISRVRGAWSDSDFISRNSLW